MHDRRPSFLPRHGMATFMTSLAALLLALANPHLKREDREPLNDIVTVVVDDSQSQTLAGRTGRLYKSLVEANQLATGEPG